MTRPDRVRDRFFAGTTRYRWLETLGRGGMGVVYKALDTDLDETVAIKVLSADPNADQKELIQRFKREINLNRKIKHPNVARLHDFGTSGDLPYITMEYVQGKDLWTVIREEGRLPPVRAIGILRQIALGTQAAHRMEIIHRDLKSANVIVDEHDAVAILDFGLARDLLTESRTLEHVVLGTPHYMSPEQALGRATDARSDIYAIGIIAFEALTGRVPFRGESPIVIGMKHVTDPVPKDLEEFRDVSAELRGIVLRALAKNPDDRYETAADLEAELEAELAISQLSQPATPIVVRPLHPIPPGPHDPTPFVPRAGRPPRRAEPPPEAGSKPVSEGLEAPFSVPPAPPQAEKEEAPPTVVAPPRGAMRRRPPSVLVVGGEYLERRKTVALLSRLDWKLHEASSGNEALEVAMKQPVDLILMEVRLPSGMDGFDVTRIVRSQPDLAQTAVVLVASEIDRSGFAFGIQSGATDVLSKSLAPSALALRLWKILHHRRFAIPATEKELLKRVRGGAGA